MLTHKIGHLPCPPGAAVRTKTVPVLCSGSSSARRAAAQQRNACSRGSSSGSTFVSRSSVSGRSNDSSLRTLRRTVAAGALPGQAATAAADEASARERLLDNYWEARGVFDAGRRRQLVDVARSLASAASGAGGGKSAGSGTGTGGGGLGGGDAEAATADAYASVAVDASGLPGVPSTWDMAARSPEIEEVSRRLVALHAALGGGDDIDTVWMVVREPRLLAEDPNELMRRLMAMRLASAGTGLDVAKVAEAQPGLLLLAGAAWDDLAALQEQLAAWDYGLASDAEPEWQAKLAQLRAYHRQHGDCSVGCREGDDRELARWAAKQRAQRQRGQLPPDQEEALLEAGFDFDEDEAEWNRWFLDLARFKELHGHATPMAMSTGADFYLTNWCSVQRVAHRCRALSARREALLDSIGFDWSGADPLS